MPYTKEGPYIYIYIYIARDEQTDLNKRSYELCWQHQEARMTNNHEVAT